ncbi:MAG: DNA-processing protein DprA, partial [Intestinibacter sp.]
RTINKIIKQGVLNSLEIDETIDYLNSLNLKTMITKRELIYANEMAKRTIEICTRENIEISTVLDRNFPQKLKNINDNPVIIYYKGNADCLSDKSIAVIGTRNPSLYGADVSYKISSTLSQRGYTIVSGLADGCDTFAHLGSLDVFGRTVAVMPCGLDMVYPKHNRALFDRIIENNGCAISEYPPGQVVSKYKFIERDRLQSALSEGVIVVETALDGGSFHTVNYAFEQNKIVGCYRHDQNYTNLKSVKGNIKLLENDKIMPIYSEETLEEFIGKLGSVFYSEKSEQIQFKLL